MDDAKKIEILNRQRAAILDQRCAALDADLNARSGVSVFVCALLLAASLSAVIAGVLPLQFSVVTVFLFAGPHNWFEFRYFLMRLPARLGRTRNFFVTAFAGVLFLTLTYVAFPLLYHFSFWSGANWKTLLAVWNTLLILWLAALVALRAKQKRRADWSWFWAVAFALASFNWFAPELFSLALVYLHPLAALVFLERHLRRTRPAWLRAYHRCLCLLPVLLCAMWWQLARAPSLNDDNGLTWRITQHAGASLLPNISTHLLVSTHVFLEMLHYGVWLLALPLIGASGAIWDMERIPLVRHPRGFPRLIRAGLTFGVFFVVLLWIGFIADYSVTRDFYFSVAIAHVLAEAPFLLRML